MKGPRSNRDLDADVIVIGAGVAGLQAAVRLQKAGCQVIVVEARTRVGGRIDTRRQPDWPAPVEMGAEFIHGRHPILKEALRSARAVVRSISPAHRTFAHGRLRVGSGTWLQAQKTVEKLLSAHKGGPDVAVDRLLRRREWLSTGTSLARTLARDYLTGFNAADLADASVRALATQQQAMDEIDGDMMSRPINGYRDLPLYLSRVFSPPSETGGQLRLGTVTHGVTWRRGAVTVESRSSVGDPLPPLRGRIAIVTVPLGVLTARPFQPGAIRFQPPLPPSIRTAMGHLRMGTARKVVLRFRAVPWKISKLGFVHVPGGAFPTLWTVVDSPRPIVVAWAGGPAADRLSAKSSAHIGHLAVKQIARITGCSVTEITTATDEVLVSDWGADPFARGAYSYVAAGGEGAAAQLATPLAGAVIFAGEATETTGHSGTVHGALLSGRRAAKSALHLLMA